MQPSFHSPMQSLKIQERPFRSRRALIYTPGNDSRKVEKTVTLGIDCICLDLEDGVAVNQKVAARAVVVDALERLDFGDSERLVRINRVGSGLEVEDLAATIASKPDGYVLPKVERASDVQWLSAQLAEAERIHGYPEQSIRILAIVETSLGVVRLPEIASADPRLDALLFGAMDMAADLGATPTRGGHELLYVRSATLTHAAAFGLQALDMVYVDFNDTEGLLREAYEGSCMGFTGKQIIHPAQVAPTQMAYTPSPTAIAYAQRVVEAFEQHQQDGSGAFALDGKMIDMPVYKSAQLTLAKAQAAERSLKHSATTDQVTRLHKRWVFEEALDREWKRAARMKTNLSMLLCVVDTNATLNPDEVRRVRDRHLLELATKIRHLIGRPADLIARYQTNALALLLPDTDLDGAMHLATKIQDRVTELNVHLMEQSIPPLRMRIAVTNALPHYATSPDSLTNLANESIANITQNGHCVSVSSAQMLL